MRKRLSCVLLAAFLVAAFSPSAAASDAYHFGVAGNRLFSCSYSYMPLQIGDTLYFPVQLLLDGNLGFSYDHSPGEYYTLYLTEQPDRYVVFHLHKSGSYDIKWQYSDSMIRRNGVFYVSLNYVGNRLNLVTSTFVTKYGTVSRVRKSDDTSSDSEVLRRIDDNLSRLQDDYRLRNGLEPITPPKPAPEIYLGFSVDADSDISAVLDVLNSRAITATFFIAPEYASNKGVRSIIVRGHTLGIRLDDDEDIDKLTRANETLRIMTLTQTRVLLGDNSAEIFEDIGYRLWDWKLNGMDSSVFRTVDNDRGACYILFECGEDSVEVLSDLLERLGTIDAGYYAINEAERPVV
ncbi:MAG: hypothetical protein FWG36_03890 [Oscillospiraceae bacterium]|nr:hypothetical protein [Oscillospiraceae bacterium]